MPALPVGNYRCGSKTRVSRRRSQNNVAVAAGATVRLDVAMEVGATQQTIEVQAHAAMLTDRHGPGEHGGVREAGERSAAGRERRGAQPLRSGDYHGGSRGQRGFQLPRSAEAGLALSA